MLLGLVMGADKDIFFNTLFNTYYISVLISLKVLCSNIETI